MKQTAVEWLIEKRATGDLYFSDFLKAKEIEKQQIIDACNQEECFGSYGYGIHEDITKGEEYYNVTFNKQVK
jgi:hypothetical protein